jgi:hypothetical protein
MRALDIAETLKSLYNSDSFTETLVDFERVLDAVHLYSYKNWMEGELVLGPVTERHWVTASFMWPEKKMPDPDGGRRLLDYGANIKYRKDVLETPTDLSPDKAKRMEQMEPGTRYPKMVKEKVWIVEITMPRQLMSEIYRGSVEIEGDTYDMEDITATQETGLKDTDIVAPEAELEPAPELNI